MRWIAKLFSGRGLSQKDAKHPAAELLTLTEKSELEALLEQKLIAFYAAHGGRSLLEPGWNIAVSAEFGADITADPPKADELARIELQALYSIRSLLTTELPNISVTRNMLPNLATEATRELSLQINRMAAELSGQPPPSTKSEQTRRDDD